jgi:hypothetical protein
MAPPPDDKKKAEEIFKKQAEDDAHFQNVSKRPFSGLVLYGNFFPSSRIMMVRFQGNNFEQDTIAFYKNKYKVTCMIPGKIDNKQYFRNAQTSYRRT